jgi:hypothetical protein
VRVMKTFKEWFVAYGARHRSYWLDGELRPNHMQHKMDLDLARRAWNAGRAYEKAQCDGGRADDIRQ